MVTALLCAFLIAEPAALSLQETARPRSVAQQIGLVRTGKNGYEEYVLAVDRLQFHPQAQALAEFKEAKAGTSLGRARKVSQAFADVLALVDQGNKKPVFDPRAKLDESSTFPEYTGFREIARVIGADAYAKLADGNSVAATDAVIRGFEFTDKVGRGVLIANLVTFASRAIVMASLDGYTLQFSQRDAKRLAAYLDELLAREPMLASGIRAEGMWGSNYLRRLAQPGTPADELGLLNALYEEPDEWAKPFISKFNALTEPQKRDAYRQAAADLEDTVRGVLKVILGPESDWGNAALEPEPNDVPSFIAVSLMPVFAQAISAEQKTRAQIRLLRLHLLITSFRWEHRRLPESLSQLQAPEAVRDPLGGEFQYEVRGESSYRLYSKGTKAIGEIDLLYRRQQPEPRPTDPP